METLAAANDRPIFAIRGAVPAYRDLTEGDHGSDVIQLQEALRLAGYVIPDGEWGDFGAATRSAVLQAYDAARFWPMTRRDGGDVPTRPTDITAEDLIVVPSTEILTFDLTFPITIDSTPAIGDSLDGESSITASSGDLAAVATLPDGMLARVQVGSAGVLGAYTPTPVAVEVVSIDDGDPDNGVAGSVLLEATDGATISEDWYGTEVVVAITIETVASNSLIVPVRAISTDAMGTSTVQRVATSGDLTTSVEVSVTGELSGLAAIQPVAGSLEAGDRVVVE